MAQKADTRQAASTVGSASVARGSAFNASGITGRLNSLREVFGHRNGLLVLAISLSFASTWLMNAVGYPAVNDFCPQAQLLSPGVGAIVAVFLALLAQYRPRFFALRATMLGTVLLLVITTALLFVAVWLESFSLALMAAILRWVGCILRDIMLGFALIAVVSHARLGVLLFAYFLRYVWIGVLWFMPYSVRVAAFFLFCPVGLLMLWPFAQPVLTRLADAGSPADLRITNPLSFLPLTHRMFVAIILFHATLGFSVTFDGPAKLTQVVSSLVVFVVLLIYAFVRQERSIDRLYALAYLLALAGLLMVDDVSAGQEALRGVCGSFCEASSSMFALVLWYLVACIGERSLAGALPVLCMIRAARGCGMTLGLATGNAMNYLQTSDPMLVIILVFFVTFIFSAYNFIFARSFSFDEMVRNIEPLHTVKTSTSINVWGRTGAFSVIGAPQAAGSQGAASELSSGAGELAGGLDDRCKRVAAEAHLTARESDVLQLLAHGRNAAYIQETLGLTRSTVKSYVADVYRKLDVHSHQALIDLVESQPE